MNSGAALHPEQPTTENTTRSAIPRSTLLFADWRVSLLALIALWAVIYMSGLSHPALLDDADTVQNGRVGRIL